MTYVVHKGVTIAGEYHAPGALIDCVPADAVAWLEEIGAIEAVEAAEPVKPAKKAKGGK
jgi:hypothetical protein